MTSSPDMVASIEPRSDQTNAEDLITGPRTVTVIAVKRGSAEQPVDIVTDEFGDGRPYKPCKTMRRVLVAAWGTDTSLYVGRRMTIYRDPDITFGRDKVGGIRISHLSDIDKRLEIALTVTRGRRAMFAVDPLPSTITQQQAQDFARRINSAATTSELDAVAAALKGCDLGEYRNSLLAAWNERREVNAYEREPTT